MSDDLLDLVKIELLPVVETLGFRVVENQTGRSFDNASVTLHPPFLRLRVVRDRGRMFLDIGPPSPANTWFDSAVVVDYLGLSDNAGFHDEDARRMLRG